MSENFDIGGNARIVADIDPRPLVSFSCGVDSIAMWLRLKELGIFDMSAAKLFYMYFVPGLPFVDDYLDYFSAHENVKIAQVPHPVFLAELASYHFQPPHRAKAIAALQKTDQSYVAMTKNQIEKYIKQSFGYSPDAYTCVGVKCGDSAMRRMAMRKTQGLNQSNKKFYPIADFENWHVVNIIKRHGLKVPVDYRLFGISYENIQYRFLRVIADHCPVSFKMICEWFPLAPLSLARYERYHPEWAGIKMIQGRKRKQFKDGILESRRPL